MLDKKNKINLGKGDGEGRIFKRCERLRESDSYIQP